MADDFGDDYHSDEFSDAHTISSDSEAQPTSREAQPTPREAQPTSQAVQSISEDGLIHFSHEGNEYIEAKDIAKPVAGGKGKRTRTSAVWKLGKEVTLVKENKPCWRCSICKNEGKIAIFVGVSTSGPLRHLKSDHGYGKRKGRLVRLRRAREGTNEMPSVAPRSQGQGSVSGPYLSIPTVDEFRSLFLQWIICCHIALIMVENPLFRKLIEFINHIILQFLPSSGNTLRQWVIEEYERQKTVKKEVLRKARSRITISFDTWTSPFSRKHVLSIIAHFVDEKWKRRHVNLSMCRLYGGHSGENIGHHVVLVLRDWGIASKVGYVITDNEPANGTAVDNIFETLEPEFYRRMKTKKARKTELRKRWVRCLAHTLNLISQAFLLGKDPEQFLLRSDTAELNGDLDTLTDLWRKRGFIGKLSNIVRYIRRSPKQRAEFERIRVSDDAGDVYWVAVEEVEDDEQHEVSVYI
jgi:hypothetical protein